MNGAALASIPGVSGHSSHGARNRCAAAALACTAIAFAAPGCSGEPSLDREALMDPAYCQSCHPEHYRQWSGSMHAYASDDPVFIALNQKLQDETSGAAAEFCIGCHAPMATLVGATVDGTYIKDVPRYLRGVTCYYCHSVDSIRGDHNGALGIADDGRMRGGITDPVFTEAHGSKYSPLHDSRSLESSRMCGACHDVVTPAGLHIERTFAEWKDSVFAEPGPGALSCNACHMPGANRPAADTSNSPTRRTHEHAWPGIDVALGPWPEISDQLAGIRRDLDPSVLSGMCVQADAGGVLVDVTLENIFAGHAWPSGVTHARRAWVELVASRGGAAIFSSGAVADDQAVIEVNDSNLWLMRSRLFDADDNEVHLAWRATRAESNLLAPSVTNDPTDPRYYHAVTRSYRIAGNPDTITMRLRMRPVGLELIDELIRHDGLDSAVRDRIPTFTLQPSVLEWTSSQGFGCVP